MISSQTITTGLIGWLESRHAGRYGKQMPGRVPIPEPTQVLVITRSLRRCCVCYALKGDLTVKKGQIAHLDRDRTNIKPGNLVWLCLLHHDAYDGRTSQSKGFRRGEVKHYRANLWTAIAQGAHLKRKRRFAVKPKLPATPYDALIRKAPKDAVLAAWVDIERAIFGAFQGRAALASDLKDYPLPTLAAALRMQAGVDQAHAEYLQDLGARHKAIANGAPCPPKLAKLYCVLAVQLIAHLRSR